MEENYVELHPKIEQIFTNSASILTQAMFLRYKPHDWNLLRATLAEKFASERNPSQKRVLKEIESYLTEKYGKSVAKCFIGHYKNLEFFEGRLLAAEGVEKESRDEFGIAQGSISYEPRIVRNKGGTSKLIKIRCMNA